MVTFRSQTTKQGESARGGRGFRVTEEGDSQYSVDNGVFKSIQKEFASVADSIAETSNTIQGTVDAVSSALDAHATGTAKNLADAASAAQAASAAVQTKLDAATKVLQGQVDECSTDAEMTNVKSDVDELKENIKQIKTDLTTIVKESGAADSAITATLTKMAADFAALATKVDTNAKESTKRLNTIISTLSLNGITIIETQGEGPYQSCTHALWALAGKAKSGHYYLNPTSKGGQGPPGNWIAYCDQVTDYGGWTLISSLPRSNTIKPGGCCGANTCRKDKGDPWYFDSDYDSSEANVGSPIPNRKGYAYLRKWEQFYSKNSQTRIMMTYNDHKVAAQVVNWCAKKQSQRSCFKVAGSGYAWGYAIVNQLYTPKTPAGSGKYAGSALTMPGTSESFLTSCTQDCSTCDQDENVHFRDDSVGWYNGWPGNGFSYGPSWRAPDTAGITWGKKSQLHNPTSSDWSYPINFYVRGETIEHLIFQSTTRYQSCKAALGKGEKKSGYYWLSPTSFGGGYGPKWTGNLYDGKAGDGAFPAYCDMERAGGGWTLLAVIHQSNSIFRSNSRSPKNNGGIHRGDKWFFEAEDQYPLYPDPYARRPYNRVWKDYYRHNGHNKLMMRHGSTNNFVTSNIKKWCGKSQSQRDCFPSGSGGGRAWGYAVLGQPKDHNGTPVGGSSTWYLNSCTADASTCDQDENLHIHEDNKKGYVGHPGSSGRKYFGMLWRSPNKASIRWGKSQAEGVTEDPYVQPITIWVG